MLNFWLRNFANLKLFIAKLKKATMRKVLKRVSWKTDLLLGSPRNQVQLLTLCRFFIQLNSNLVLVDASLRASSGGVVLGCRAMEMHTNHDDKRASGMTLKGSGR